MFNPVVLKLFLKFRLYGPQRFFSITHGPLFLSINSGSAAKRNSRVADVKYMYTLAPTYSLTPEGFMRAQAKQQRSGKIRITVMLTPKNA